MYTWIIAGEKTTRRIRERYIAAVMRQNIAYFDRLGAGAVTTRIEVRCSCSSRNAASTDSYRDTD